MCSSDLHIKYIDYTFHSLKTNIVLSLPYLPTMCHCQKKYHSMRRIKISPTVISQPLAQGQGAKVVCMTSAQIKNFFF